MHVADECMLDLLQKMLCYSPKKRISAINALIHPYFSDVRKHSAALKSVKQVSLIPPFTPGMMFA